MVLLSNLKLLKKPLFSKATMVMQRPAKKNAGCPKARRDFPTLPHQVALGPCPPPPESVRTGVRAYADVTTKFLAWVCYQICLPMVLCWRALHSGALLLKGLYLTCGPVSSVVSKSGFLLTWKKQPTTLKIFIRTNFVHAKLGDIFFFLWQAAQVRASNEVHKSAGRVDAKIYWAWNGWPNKTTTQRTLNSTNDNDFAVVLIRCLDQTNS